MCELCESVNELNSHVHKFTHLHIHTFTLFNLKNKYFCSITSFLILVSFSVDDYAQQPHLVLPVGHTSAITSAVYSPDGKYIVTASWDNTAKIWEASDGRLLNELKGHLASLTSAAFSPACPDDPIGGKYIVTTSKDKTAKIWSTTNGVLLHDLVGHTDWVSTAVFSPDGKYVLTASWDSTARIWNALTGKFLQVLKGHKGSLTSGVFSPPNKADPKGGKYILTASMDETARIWLASNGTPVHTLEGHTEWVTSASYNDDGKYIITASNDKTAKTWTASDGHLLNTLTGHTRALRSASFSPSSKSMTGSQYIVTSSWDSTARIWQASTGRLLQLLKGHKDAVISAVFSPDAKYVLTASLDSCAKVWMVVTGELITDFRGHKEALTCGSFSADGKNALTASLDQTCRIWSAMGGFLLSELKGHTNVLTSANFSPATEEDKPGGKYIAAISWDNTVKIWESSEGRLISQLKGHSHWINTAVFSPDGRSMVTASLDNSVRIFSIPDGNLLHDLKGHTEAVSSASYSPDGRYIVSASWDSTANIWDAADGKLLRQLKGHKNILRSAMFSPTCADDPSGGKFIVTGSWDNTARIWRTSDGMLLYELKGHTDSLRSAIYSPDGKLIVTASWDNTARIWSAGTGKQLFELKAHTASLNSAAFSPDSKYVVTSSLDNTACIWDAATGKLMSKLSRHSKAVAAATFSPDSRYVVTASWDNTGNLWDVATGRLIGELNGHTGSLKSAMFSPDGKYIVTTSEDNTLKKWNALTGGFLYTFFAVDSTNFLAVDKDGRYDGNEAARRMLYYVCDNEIIDLEQFKDLSWEPGLVSKLMGRNTEPVTAKKLSEINVCNTTPEVKEDGFKDGAYHFSVYPRQGGLGEIQVYVNGKLIQKYDPASLLNVGNRYSLVVKEAEISDYFMAGAYNRMVVKATTKGGSMISRGAVVTTLNEKKGRKNPDMYIITIGISRYKDEKLRLTYASKDAVDLATVMVASAKNLLNTDGRQHVFSYSFNTDGNGRWPLKLSIEKLVDSLSYHIKSEDITVMFFAGHGILLAGQKSLYLLTAEASGNELTGIEKEVAISTEELREWSGKIKANKQVLILDACNSGQAIKNLQQIVKSRDVPADQQRALENLRDKTGLFILSASAADQAAYENKLYEQGLLTYSLLSGIKLGTGLRENKYIDVTRWFNAAAENVKVMAKDLGGRQDPQIIGNASFEVGLVDKEVVDNIKLALKKNLFRNSRMIIDPELLNDDLDLSVMIDKELSNITDRYKDNPLVFVSNNMMLEAYSIRGQYVITEKKINVKVSLFKGLKDRVNQFEISGSTDNLTNLVERIIDKVVVYLYNN